MKIRDITVTDTHGEEHFIAESNVQMSETKSVTVFRTRYGETIKIEIEYSDMVAGSYQN